MTTADVSPRKHGEYHRVATRWGALQGWYFALQDAAEVVVQLSQAEILLPCQKCSNVNSGVEAIKSQLEFRELYSCLFAIAARYLLNANLSSIFSQPLLE